MASTRSSSRSVRRRWSSGQALEGICIEPRHYLKASFSDGRIDVIHQVEKYPWCCVECCRAMYSSSSPSVVASIPCRLEPNIRTAHPADVGRVGEGWGNEAEHTMQISCLECVAHGIGQAGRLTRRLRARLFRLYCAVVGPLLYCACRPVALVPSEYDITTVVVMCIDAVAQDPAARPGRLQSLSASTVT